MPVYSHMFIKIENLASRKLECSQIYIICLNGSLWIHTKSILFNNSNKLLANQMSQNQSKSKTILFIPRLIIQLPAVQMFQISPIIFRELICWFSSAFETNNTTLLPPNSHRKEVLFSLYIHESDTTRN